MGDYIDDYRGNKPVKKVAVDRIIGNSTKRVILENVENRYVTSDGLLKVLLEDESVHIFPLRNVSMVSEYVEEVGWFKRMLGYGNEGHEDNIS